jgi:hypothetical protein
MMKTTISAIPLALAGRIDGNTYAEDVTLAK